MQRHLLLTLFLLIILLIAFFYSYQNASPVYTYPYIYATPCTTCQLPIPKNIYITYANLSAIPTSTLSRWRELNPNHTIHLYDDFLCRQSLLPLGSWAITLFDAIPDGPIKADFWRAAILFLNGGIYVDVDSSPLVPIDSVLPPLTTFSTSMSYVQDETNPMFIAATKENPILASVLLIYHQNVSSRPYSYWGYSICPIMASVLSLYTNLKNAPRIITTLDQTIVLLSEHSLSFHPLLSWLSHRNFYYNMHLWYIKPNSNSKIEHPFILNRASSYKMGLHAF